MLDASLHETSGMTAGYRAKRIRELRERAGLDQAQLAEKAGTAWPCEAIGPGGVVILGECDEMR